MKTKNYFIIILIAFTIFVVYKYLNPKNATDASKKPSAKQVTPISIYIAGVNKFSKTLQVNANVLANESVELHPEISGRITQINFKEGEKVRKGQLLLKLNDVDWKAQLLKAEATLKKVSAIDNRNKTLIEKGAISQEQFEQSSADLAASIADVNVIKENIRKTEIIAPFDGKIGLRNVSVGAVVTPSTLIAVLEQTQSLKIEFALPEIALNRIKTGEQITFESKQYSQKFHATIYAIEPRMDANTRSLTMRAIFNNEKQLLVPGSYASVEVPLTENVQTIQIPTQSVIPILKGHKVFVVNGDSVLEKNIHINYRDDRWVFVDDGIKPSDSIVCNGVMFMKKGAKVKITTIENALKP